MNKIANLISHDKSLHIIAGFVVFAAGNFLNTMLAIFFVLLLGGARELYGALKPEASTFDLADFVATLGGGALAFACAAGGIAWG